MEETLRNKTKVNYCRRLACSFAGVAVGHVWLSFAMLGPEHKQLQNTPVKVKTWIDPSKRPSDILEDPETVEMTCFVLLTQLHDYAQLEWLLFVSCSIEALTAGHKECDLNCWDCWIKWLKWLRERRIPCWQKMHDSPTLMHTTKRASSTLWSYPFEMSWGCPATGNRNFEENYTVCRHVVCPACWSWFILVHWFIQNTASANFSTTEKLEATCMLNCQSGTSQLSKPEWT